MWDDLRTRWKLAGEQNQKHLSYIKEAIIIKQVVENKLLRLCTQCVQLPVFGAHQHKASVVIICQDTCLLHVCVCPDPLWLHHSSVFLYNLAAHKLCWNSQMISIYLIFLIVLLLSCNVLLFPVILTCWEIVRNIALAPFSPLSIKICLVRVEKVITPHCNMVISLFLK